MNGKNRMNIRLNQHPSFNLNSFQEIIDRLTKYSGTHKEIFNLANEAGKNKLTPQTHDIIKKMLTNLLGQNGWDVEKLKILLPILRLTDLFECQIDHNDTTRNVS